MLLFDHQGGGAAADQTLFIAFTAPSSKHFLFLSYLRISGRSLSLSLSLSLSPESSLYE